MKLYKKLFLKLFTKSVIKRRLFFFISDTVLIAFSMYLSFWMRFNGKIPDNYVKSLPYFISLALAIKLIFLILYNLYDISWRFVSLDELIKAFAIIRRKYPKIHLLILGVYSDLSYKAHFQKLVTFYNLDLSVTLLPTVPSYKVTQYLCLGDLAIIPWHFAPVINLATPNKLFEYMACGLPILASNLDGLCKIIKSGENGFLFEPNNLDSLVTTLEQAIHSSELSSIGTQNRKSIEHKYNLQKHISLLLELCQRLLNRKRKKR